MRYLVLALITVAMLGTQGCTAFAKKNAADRRTAGTQLEDSTIEKTATERIQEKYKDASQVTLTSYNRAVLITGDALSEDIKTDVERIVRSVPNVKKTTNEVLVGALSPTASKRTDARITANVKSLLGKNKTLQAATFQVTTSHAVVYLLGFTTHAEGNVAAEIASTTADVKQVIKAFDYID
jgi:osmotically-inducible protein OsmY